MLQACILAHQPYEASTVVPLIDCLMRTHTKPDPALGPCLAELGLDVSPEAILDCANSDQGSDLLHTLGVETHNLDPALYFVPWILFNGVRRYILKKLKISPHPFSFAFSFFYQSKFLHLLIHISSSSHKKSKISVPRFNLADFSGTICSCFSSSSGLFSTFGKTFCTLENWIVIFSSRGKGKILEHENAAV